MTIDLQYTLADLAGSVHDDALTKRLTAQVGPMVGRIRRRRAARTAAIGTASMGTVAAMAVGAIALANGGGSTPAPGPATQAPPQPTATHDGMPLECDAALPAALVSDDALAVDGEIPAVTAYGDAVPTIVRWWAPGPDQVRYADARIDLAVSLDGQVVGVAYSEWQNDPPLGYVDLGSTETGTNGTYGDQMTIVACGGDTPLDAGDYEVVATVTLTSGDGETWRSSTGPWPLTIAPVPLDGADGADGADTEDPDGTEAEAAVQEIIAGAEQLSTQHPIGTCGTLMPVVGDEPLALELDLDDGTGMRYAPGAPIDAVTILTPAGAQTSVLANVPESGATVVLVRDGVVVGRGPEVEDTTMLLETTAEAQVLYGTGEATLCSLPGADAPQLALPPGLYQAYAILPVALKEVTEADGTARSVSDTLVLHSQPVDVIVEAPRD